MSFWHVAYQWGVKPGEYSRCGVALVEAVDVYGALAAWAHCGGCVNSRITYVAEAGVMRGGIWRPQKKAGRVPKGRAEA